MNQSLLDMIKNEDLIEKFRSENNIELENGLYSESCYHKVEGGYYSIFNGRIDLKKFFKYQDAKQFFDKFQLPGVVIAKYPLKYKKRVYVIGYDKNSYYSFNIVVLFVDKDKSYIELISKSHFDIMLKSGNYISDSDYQTILQENNVAV